MNNLKKMLVLIVAIVLTMLGTIGYSVLEGWSIHDSLYMTIITLTTTGFQEVHHMSEAGRNLTMLLLMIGMITVTYSLSIIMNDLFSINLNFRRKKKMEKKINNLKNHTIICGYGRMGKVVVEEMLKEKKDIVVIDNNKEKLKYLDQLDVLNVAGDVTHDEVLHKAKIQSAKTLVSIIDSDSDALYLALAARSLNANIKIIVRASDESARMKILRAGADKVILPIVMTGVKLAQAVMNPEVEDLIDLDSLSDTQNNQLYEVFDLKINLYPKLIGKNLSECKFEEHVLIPIGIKNSNNDFKFNPNKNYKVGNDDIVLLLGSKNSINSFITGHQI